MASHMSHEPKPVVDEFADEFDEYLDRAKQSASFRAEYEDAQSLQRIIDSLVKLRKALGLSQAEVARRMNVRQPTISGFEKESSDPKLSTLQRYARAIEARLNVGVEMPADCDWVSPSVSAYGGLINSRVKMDNPSAKKGHLARDWKSSPSYKRSDYGCAA